MKERRDLAIAVALAAATVAAMAATEEAIGFARDEGVYFVAGERYARWVQLLFSRPLEALSGAGIARYFSYNPEHPGLTKLLFGLSHAALAGRLTDHATGFRAPAFLFAGLVSACTYLLGVRVGDRRVGVLAVLGFWLTPRQFHHGHLAAFDVPVTATWLLALLAWRAAVEPGAGRRRWLAAGAAFGLALATKLNGFFLPAAFGLHWLLGPGRRAFAAGGPRQLLRSFPRATPWVAALGVLVLFASWPWLWHRPVERFLFYVRFHLDHVHYPWQYLGRDLRAPPFPVEYVAVLTALTVPLPWVVLQAGGLVRGLAAAWRARTEASSDDLVLVLVGAGVPLAVITNPWAPHFGGVKHWLPAMPFLCVLAAAALVAGADALAARAPRLAKVALPALAALVLAPGLWGVALAHPWGTVFYNELAGGGAGGAALGMQRQFWSNDVTAVLPEVNALAPPEGRVWLHEVNRESVEAYRRDGLLRADLVELGSARGADVVAHQHMFEFRDQEFQAWNELGTRRAAAMFAWQEAPQVTVYARPPLDAAPPPRVP